MRKNTSLTIGTRSSPLALRQSAMVADALRAAHGFENAAIKIIEITTKGDRALDGKLSELGGKGLFTEELEAGLRSGTMDLAVHSLKDLPTQNEEGLTLGAILPRASAHDMLIVRDGLTVSGMADLPRGAHIGTASLRRQAQILCARPDINISLLRGNIGTRLKKLKASNMDATLLAAAGLARLNMMPAVAVELDSDAMLPAAGQGALAVQCRANDEATLALLAPLNCAATQACVTAERSFLQALDGSCRTPIAALATITNNTLFMHGRLLADDGSDMVETRVTCAPNDAEATGRSAGQELGRSAPHLVTR